ncbi:hypothetical protein LCGC14_2187330, partial [marine sediment metagenome]
VYPKVKLIYMVRSYRLDYYFPSANEKTKKLFAKAYTINCVSRGIMERIQTDFDLKNVSFIKNPVDFDHIEALAAKATNNKEQYIVAAGRMSVDVKQFDKLIETYAKSDLPQKGIALKLLGDGKLMADYKKLAAALNIQEWVHFEGFQENPFPYFKNALFTVLCSKFEGSPRVLLESLACGTPVVATDVGGMKRIIDEGKTGVVIKNNDPYPFARKISRFLSMSCDKAASAESTRASVLRFGWSNIADAIISEYWTVLKDHSDGFNPIPSHTIL